MVWDIKVNSPDMTEKTVGRPRTIFWRGTWQIVMQLETKTAKTPASLT